VCQEQGLGGILFEGDTFTQNDALGLQTDIDDGGTTKLNTTTGQPRAQLPLLERHWTDSQFIWQRSGPAVFIFSVDDRHSLRYARDFKGVWLLKMTRVFTICADETVPMRRSTFCGLGAKRSVENLPKAKLRESLLATVHQRFAADWWLVSGCPQKSFYGAYQELSNGAT
jgi:hypothetical protein